MTRLEELRAQFQDYKIDAYYVPKVDEFMGEYIRPFDERLEWISGFTGSAGFALITLERAMLFVDSRYTIQAKQQSPDFEIIDYPQNQLIDFTNNMRLGFDPNLMTVAQYKKLYEKMGDQLIATPNLIDDIWQNRPNPKEYKLRKLAPELSEFTSQEKIKKIAKTMPELGIDAYISNNPESLAWTLNLRGGEIEMLPAPMGYMVVKNDQTVDIFGVTPPDFETQAHFHPLNELNTFLENFKGKMGYNETSLPYGRLQSIQNPKAIKDPIIAMKARKDRAEIRASHQAHDADGLAMIKFLSWLDAQDPTTLDEIKLAKQLLEFRLENPDFRVSSFDTISAWNANAANAHYHATNENFAHLGASGIYLVDSGGHYNGATTDITRTIQIGQGIEAARAPFTEVLNGLAAISNLKFPKGLAGRDIDALARHSLWASGRNYGHGTGHGVGAELSVHEGPASLSPRGEVPLEAGMILSLEPGYYREGEFGIRTENLALVVDDGDFLKFETLSFVPIDQRLISQKSLTPQARNWLNEYHKNCFEKHKDSLNQDRKNWLKLATKPI